MPSISACRFGSTLGRSLDKNSTAPRSTKCCTAGGYYNQKRRVFRKTMNIKISRLYVTAIKTRNYFWYIRCSFSKHKTCNDIHETSIYTDIYQIFGNTDERKAQTMNTRNAYYQFLLLFIYYTDYSSPLTLSLSFRTSNHSQDAKVISTPYNCM